VTVGCSEGEELVGDKEGACEGSIVGSDDVGVIDGPE